jgi:hypothetical protein
LRARGVTLRAYLVDYLLAGARNSRVRRERRDRQARGETKQADLHEALLKSHVFPSVEDT